MEYLIGLSLALGVSLTATVVGFDRDRVLYAFMAVVIASYYDLFAVLGGSSQTLKQELVLSALFVIVSVIGFRTSLWLVVGALAGHGVFDIFHADLIANAGVPVWWPMFCMTYDLTAAAYLALLLSFAGLSATRNGGRDSLQIAKVEPPRTDRSIRPQVQMELDAAANQSELREFQASFRHLERAHILSQVSTLEHVRVHWRMLVWAVRQRDVREICGQVFRILGAATMTAFGLVPAGNTGGSNVSAVQPMRIPDDLAAIIAARSE
ncbi:DUF3703 domain-containing protein [Tabrizicola sp. BL-A-41-H6]|uniref:DUF3703 domain-containing protein n=1 Tax=Tabrizicola sp. BL-A-41-H6 TaxID=3421107 RepID=UPI003D67EC54